MADDKQVKADEDAVKADEAKLAADEAAAPALSKKDQKALQTILDARFPKS